MISLESSKRILQTLDSIKETIQTILEWNKNVMSTEDYYSSQSGMQLLAANCTLITAIGEGIKRIDRIDKDFLRLHFPTIRWKDIVGMRDHIAHGYFELDADVVFEAISNDVPELYNIINKAIDLCKEKLEL